MSVNPHPILRSLAQALAFSSLLAALPTFAQGGFVPDRKSVV